MQLDVGSPVGGPAPQRPHPIQQLQRWRLQQRLLLQQSPLSHCHPLLGCPSQRPGWVLSGPPSQQPSAAAGLRHPEEGKVPCTPTGRSAAGAAWEACWLPCSHLGPPAGTGPVGRFAGSRGAAFADPPSPQCCQKEETSAWAPEAGDPGTPAFGVHGSLAKLLGEGLRSDPTNRPNCYSEGTEAGGGEGGQQSSPRISHTNGVPSHGEVTDQSFGRRLLSFVAVQVHGTIRL